MATIRNAVDIALQGTDPRIVSINLPGNITVPWGQIPGGSGKSADYATRNPISIQNTVPVGIEGSIWSVSATFTANNITYLKDSIYIYGGGAWIKTADATESYLGGSGVNVMPPRYCTFEEKSLPPIIDINNCTLSLDTTAKFFGTKSLKMVITGTDSYCYLTDGTKNVAVTPNSKWLLSAYVYSSIAGDGFFYTQTNENPDNLTDDIYHPHAYTIPTANLWTRVTVLVDLKLNNSTALLVRLGGIHTANIGMMWFDGIMLETQIGDKTTPSVYHEPPNFLTTFVGALDATKNTIYRTTSAPSGGTYTEGDLWFDTTADSVPTFYQRVGGTWSIVSNAVTNTSQVADGAGLGTKAIWANVTDNNETRPANNATNDYTFVNTTYPADKLNLQGQIDGKIESWFQTANPADSWIATGTLTAAQVKAIHTGDTWFNTTTTVKKLYRYNGTGWDEITDKLAIDAYANASTAQSTADGKAVVFIGAINPTNYDIGDLWDSGATPRNLKAATTASATYDSAHWVVTATVGANSSNLTAGTGTNLCVNSDFTFGSTLGWNKSDQTIFSAVGVNNPEWFVDGGNTVYLYQNTNATVGSSEIQSTDIPVIAGGKYEYQARTGAHRCNVDVFVYWFTDELVNGVFTVAVNKGNTHRLVFNDNTNYGGRSLAGYKLSGTIVTAPVGATYARLVIRKNATLSPGSDSWAFITQCYFGQANAGQTELSNWVAGPLITSLWGNVLGNTKPADNATVNNGAFANLSGQLTSSNISGLVDSGAITNAYIGNVLRSANYSQTERTGWNIDKTGNITSYGAIEMLSGGLVAETLKILSLDAAHTYTATKIGATFAKTNGSNTAWDKWAYSDNFYNTACLRFKFALADTVCAIGLSELQTESDILTMGAFTFYRANSVIYIREYGVNVQSLAYLASVDDIYEIEFATNSVIYKVYLGGNLAPTILRSVSVSVNPLCFTCGFYTVGSSFTDVEFGQYTLGPVVSQARLEITGNVIKVYDSYGGLRVQLGDLSA